MDPTRRASRNVPHEVFGKGCGVVAWHGRRLGEPCKKIPGNSSGPFPVSIQDHSTLYHGMLTSRITAWS